MENQLNIENVDENFRNFGDKFKSSKNYEQIYGSFDEILSSVYLTSNFGELERPKTGLDYPLNG